MAQDNYFGRTFLDLSIYLKAAVPKLRWVDQDFGQLETYSYRPDVDFPCALIDFASTGYSELAELAQIGDVTVIIRMAVNPFSQSNSAAPLDVRDKALDYYNLEQEIFEAVQGWHNDISQPFIRLSADTERDRGDGLRVRQLMFATGYEDYSAVPMTEKRPASLEVETEQE